jgi:hypothetical protein
MSEINNFKVFILCKIMWHDIVMIWQLMNDMIIDGWCEHLTYQENYAKWLVAGHSYINIEDYAARGGVGEGRVGVAIIDGARVYGWWWPTASGGDG